MSTVWPGARWLLEADGSELDDLSAGDGVVLSVGDGVVYEPADLLLALA